MWVKKQQLEPNLEQRIGLGLRKENDRSVCCHPVYLTCMLKNAGLDNLQAEIKTGGRNINNVRYADDATLVAESKDKLKSLLMRVKEESGKTGLKLSILKTKIMASKSHHFMANRRGKSGNNERFYFLGLQNQCGQYLHNKSKNACSLEGRL